MDVFSGDAWNIFDWELGCETLPVDGLRYQLWYDYHYWNDEGLFQGAKTTTEMAYKVESRRESELLTSSASAQSIVRPRSDSGAEVVSTPVLATQECLPALRLTTEQTGISADTPGNPLRPTLSSANFPHPAVKAEMLTNVEPRALHKSFGQRPKKAKPNATSQYKGVTKHRATGKYEAHLWDASVIRKGKNRRGRHRGKQIYLGSFSNELAAARTFDMAAICYWGDGALTNFPLSDYSADIDLLKTAERDKVVKLLRRSEGGYLPGSGRFVGLALLRAMHYDEGADFRTSFDNLPY